MTSMVRMLVLVASLRFHATAGAPSICIGREENNGLMNAIPARVYGTHGSRRRRLVELYGGVRVCVRMDPGKWLLEASSVEPYKPENRDPNACHSNRLIVRLAASEVASISVSPRFEGSTYVCGWQLDRTSQ
jgi:hypothetical protein